MRNARQVRHDFFSHPQSLLLYHLSTFFMQSASNTELRGLSLILAAEWGAVKVMDFLLEHRDITEWKNSKGRTALCGAMFG